MVLYQSLHCDVFAPRIGAGNPLAVILQADALDTAQMQAIAGWMNLAETTFVLAPSVPEADYRVRIFTTQKEIAFAGHPSIGTAHALLSQGLQPKTAGVLMQECQAGVLPIRHQPGQVNNTLSVRVPSSKLVHFAQDGDALFNRILPPALWAALKPALVEGGRRWWLAELQDEQSVRQFVPDSFAIKQLAEQTNSLGLCIFARRQAPESGLVVRAFPLGVGIFEDPASGAANAAIAAFLEETGNLAGLGRRYTVSQGREIGRDAVLTLEIDANRDVWVGGDCQTVIRGELDW
ncbi:MAG: PhzF family phenazine biosynthesis protein [Arenimonas sp.]|nr:PhzF family phenazine biosynthesis protein [Arenimonas sp.]MBP7981790.1 PhzF family phenazine biosynthesis protein [Arenimonas sp.]